MTQREAWRLATFIQRARARRDGVFTNECVIALSAFVEYSSTGYKAETWLKLALSAPVEDDDPPPQDSTRPSEEWDKFINGLLGE